MEEAIDEYIALHHSRLVKPLINQVDGKGKKKHNVSSATAQIKATLLQMYVK